mgnify:FL=1
MTDYDYMVGRIMDLEARVERLEQRRGVEAWEDGPKRNPGQMMPERGERIPLLPGRQEPQDARPQVGAIDGLGKCRRFSLGTRAALAREAPCNPTGTDPMPVVAAAETGFAVFTGSGRWEP